MNGNHVVFIEVIIILCTIAVSSMLYGVQKHLKNIEALLEKKTDNEKN